MISLNGWSEAVESTRTTIKLCRMPHSYNCKHTAIDGLEVEVGVECGMEFVSECSENASNAIEINLHPFGPSRRICQRYNPHPMANVHNYWFFLLQMANRTVWTPFFSSPLFLRSCGLRKFPSLMWMEILINAVINYFKSSTAPNANHPPFSWMCALLPLLATWLWVKLIGEKLS